MFCLSREGGVSPCALVLGLLYIQRLAKMNPQYLKRTTSSDVFLIALVSTPHTLASYDKSRFLPKCCHILASLLLHIFISLIILSTFLFLLSRFSWLLVNIYRMKARWRLW